MAEDAIKETVNAKPKKKKTNGVVKFFRDLKGEFKKIVWPSKKQIINNTIIVIVAIIVIGLFIWAMDFGLAAISKLFLGNA